MTDESPFLSSNDLSYERRNSPNLFGCWLVKYFC